MKNIAHIKNILTCAALIAGLAACVVEPAPLAYAPPPPGPAYAAAPAPYYGCCYAYPEYPVPYGYYAPSFAVGYYSGGPGGWHHGWHR